MTLKTRSTWLTVGMGAIGAIALGNIQATPAIALTYNPTPTTFASGLSSPNGIAVINTGANAGNVWVAGSTIRGYDSNGNFLSTATAGSSAYRGATVTSSGDLLVVDRNNSLVRRFDSSGNSPGVFVNTNQSPHGIAVIPGTGDVLVSHDSSLSFISVAPFVVTNPATVLRFSSNGAPLGTFGSGYSTPRGIAVESSTGNVLIADFADNTVRRYDSNGTSLGTFGTGYSSPWGIVIDSSGDVLVANSDRVLRFDSGGTLQQTLFTVTSGPSRPTYMAIDSTGALLVANQDNGTVSRFTTATPVPFGFSPLWVFASVGLRSLFRRRHKQSVAIAK